MPTTTVRVRLGEHGGGTRMEVRSVFDSREQMEWMVRMRAPERFAEAVGQIDALLAANGHERGDSARWS